ncbi:AzlD domain-containing protein [Nocardioides bigeumensis]|uniref:AzlD domain-containing protein n=1 Tax=Nocardioides bigeumensis TaxID=433657 RepID=A0ABN2Y4N9_9ACTN
MTIWLTILGLVVATVAIKAFGPVLFGGRELPRAFIRVISCMAPALLAALVLTSLFADGQRLTAGAQALGVAVGGALLLARRSIVLAVLAAVVVTAALRALA